jgi:hypothetical protein
MNSVAILPTMSHINPFEWNSLMRDVGGSNLAHRKSHRKKNERKQLTPWSRCLLQKLTVAQPVKKIHIFV